MPNPKCSDDDFIRLFRERGASRTASALKVTERAVYARRDALQNRYGISIKAPNNGGIIAEVKEHQKKEYPHRVEFDVKNGVVIVGSDFHIWPGAESTCLRAFKKFCDDLRPSAVILNGDVLDFPKISRHPPIGWESAPSPIEEIEAAQDHLHDISQASKRACKCWTLGNHDARFETRLATVASEYRGIKGIHLSDHFGGWDKGWSCYINGQIEGGRTMIKHRFKGGQNAPRANTLNAGVHMVTGHLHSQKVVPVSDYLGDRYGVDSGCVADKDHKAFVDYTEDAPLDWRSGFAVLTYKDGKLLMPELVSKWDGKHVQFRGQLIKV